MYELFFNSVTRRQQSRRRAFALALTLVAVCTTARAEDPITFVFPAANFQPVAADAYPEGPPPQPPLVPPQASPAPPTPAQLRDPSPTEVKIPTEATAPTRLAPPAAGANESYLTAPEYNALDCPTCDGCNGCGGLPPGRLPNGQYPDDWFWGCGQWPYANGPGTCDDWKVGPIWDVTVDGMVMTRESTDLPALEERMADLHDNPALPAEPQFTEQFDRGPGGRVYLTGLLPKVGYQVMAGYEGIEEWNASLLYPEQVDEFPPFDDPTTQRSLNYRSSLHSGELNIMRICNPALRPYCGVRYIKFDDEIWDQSVQTMTPFPPVLPATAISTLDAYDVENNLIGFQGGVKYDIWNWGRRFSLQGFLNSGVYYNKAKYSNLQQEFETQWVDDGSGGVTVSSDSESQLTIVENSNIAYVGEASLTAVCRLNRCWACRAGYQVLFIDGLNLASDAYLQVGAEDRSLLFHGWHAGLECRR